MNTDEKTILSKPRFAGTILYQIDQIKSCPKKKQITSSNICFLTHPGYAKFHTWDCARASWHDIYYHSKIF